MNFRRAGVGLTLAALLHLPAWAQIKVGQTVGLNGPVAATVAESRQGAMLWLDATNARGGVNGQKIELVTLDDLFEVKQAEANVRRLITYDVVALFLNRGTPHTQAVMPLLAEARMPLIAPSTGAMVLHQPVNPWIFNVRTTYQREAERVVQLLLDMGQNRIAIVQVDDSFGADAVQGALKALGKANTEPAAHLKYDRNKPDFSTITPALVKLQPQAVLFLGSGTAVVDGMKALRQAGSQTRLVTLSNNASGGFAKQLGEHARGVIVSQVFPFERSQSVAMIRELRGLAQAKGISEVSPAMVEGFAGPRSWWRPCAGPDATPPEKA